MNDQRLSDILSAIHEQRTHVADPAELRSRVSRIPAEHTARRWRFSPPWRWQGARPIFRATRLVVGVVAIALFGVFLLAGDPGVNDGLSGPGMAGTEMPALESGSPGASVEPQEPRAGASSDATGATGVTGAAETDAVDGADPQGQESDMQRAISSKGLVAATAAATLAAGLAVASATPLLAQEEPAIPTMIPFSGVLGCGGDAPLSDHQIRDFPVVEMSEPRLDGRWLQHVDGYEDSDPDIDGIGAYSILWEISTDAGSWVGADAGFRYLPVGYSTNTVALEGRGDYEGLVAINEHDFLDSCGFDIRGVVVEGALPETPEPIDAG